MKFSVGFATIPLMAAALFIPAQAQPIVVSVSTCDFFQSAQEAQAFFERDPVNNALLDANGDGLACTHLPSHVRTDGMRVSGGSTSLGWSYEIWQSSVEPAYREHLLDVYYIRAWRQSDSNTILTTGNFASQRDAYDYFKNYLE